MAAVIITRIFLELRDRSQLIPVAPRDHDVRYVHRAPCGVPHYRELYRAVGAPWLWCDRQFWSDERLETQLASPNVAVWELIAGGNSAGFFELQRGDDGVEITYFGLRPEFIGRGLGGPMLTRAVEEGWAMGAERVWLHTCTLDSPHALPNYRARGFTEYRRETYETQFDARRSGAQHAPSSSADGRS